jgi:two-component system, chemotaxis family, sensor kinase CheA
MISTNKKYKDIFTSEAKEKLDKLSNSLVDLEKEPERIELAEDMMRAAHTLKSSSAAMGYTDIQKLTHSLEDQFETIRQGKKKADSQLIQSMFTAVDKLRSLVNKTSGIPDQKQAKTSVPEFIEEIKVKTERLDRLLNLTEELLVNKMRLRQLADEQNSEIKDAVGQLERLLSDLQFDVMQLRLVPIGFLLERLPRIVRDLAQEQGKLVELKTQGKDIELDRSIVDNLGEPLVHLVRNSISHGIEEKGTVVISARRERGIAVVEVEDDGKGINWQEIMKTQEQRNIKTKKPDDILFSGVSTSEKVTEVSGRGVGLSIVKARIEALGGSVSVKSPLEDKSGTKFTLQLPLSIAIIKALLVSVKDQAFAIPLGDVEKTVVVELQSLRKAFDREVALISEQDVPLVRLAEKFNNKASANGETKQLNNDKLFTVVVKQNGKPLGLVVDKFIDEQEITVKPLTGAQRLAKQFSGLTILGDGKPALILDVENITSL